MPAPDPSTRRRPGSSDRTGNLTINGRTGGADGDAGPPAGLGSGAGDVIVVPLCPEVLAWNNRAFRLMLEGKATLHSFVAVSPCCADGPHA